MIPAEKQWGRVAAVDIDSGKVAWKHDTEQPLIGGGLATAGCLYFFGESNGNFNALDSKTGKKASVSKTRSEENVEDLGHYLAGLY